ncbi:MAG TPA: DUF1778 domain-containing protein [Alphaproteobacteria bacterium]|nr:DUF1778 domain-containing protein [Alphaproteobacteria bacterium]HAJ46366.1 DUF1778 domain-containing protein [Alphaproteobacteria bacterium]
MSAAKQARVSRPRTKASKAVTVAKRGDGASLARLEARLPADALDLLKRAAELQGRTLTDFVVSAARAAAIQALKDEIVVRLDTESSRFVASLLDNPPAPKPALKRAFTQHKRLIGSH